MQCTKCKESNMKSIVYQIYSSRTLLNHFPYWDTDGMYHHHDENIDSFGYRCSNDHTWEESKMTGYCHCGWKAEALKK